MNYCYDYINVPSGDYYAPSNDYYRHNFISRDTLLDPKHFLLSDMPTTEADIAEKLPLCAISDLYDLDNKLQHQEFADVMKSYLGRLRGISCSIDDVFKKVIDDRCIEEFNWDGRSGKRSMSKLTLFNQIFFDVFFPLDRKEVEKQLRRSVELSHNRIKQKRHTQKKKDVTKNTTGNAINCSSIQQWREDHDKQMSCNCLKMSKFAQGHVCKAQNKSETAKIPSPDDITVAEILSTELGKKLIESYQNGGQLLHPIDRTMLVHKIVQYYIDNNMKMSVPKMKNISEQIVEMFPTENKHTYLISRGRLTPKGKLWDRYQGRMRYLKKLSCKRQAYQREMDLTAVKSTRNVKDSFKEDTDSLTEDELAKMVSTLTHDIEWNQFLVKWRQTVRYRRNDIDNKHNSKLSSILKKWPFYKWPKAPELINIDFEHFEHLISEQENLEQKWQHFLNVAPNLFKMRIKELTAKQNLNDFLELKPLLTTDAISFETIHLLHAVLKPTITCVNNKRKKYSISDSQSAFTLLVSHRRDIDEELNTWQESCLRNETSRHPIVVVVGIHFHIKEFYVALDDIKWKFDSYLNVLEYCFKLFYVLNLPYPRECSMVWKFVQEYLYGIKTQESLIYPMLETFIGDINALQHSVE